MVVKMDIDWGMILSQPVNIWILVGLALLFAVQLMLGSYVWHRLLALASGEKNQFWPVYVIYSRANLAKYMPGNVMHYAGRNLLGERLGLKQAHILTASAMELILTVLSAVLYSLVFSFSYLRQAVQVILNNRAYSIVFGILIVLGCAAVAMLVFFAIKSEKVRHYLQTFLSWLAMLESLLAIFCYCATFLANGIINLILIRFVLGVEISPEAVFPILGLTTISWLAGYVIPGAPGGIGIRESISILLMSPLVGSESIAVVAILQRVVNVLGDILMYFIGVLLNLGMGKKEEAGNSIKE
jgi:uncharacterized membrane protein YbhN (UPF0104 family)